MDCHRCGSSNPDAVKFCGECGVVVGHTCLACGELNAYSNQYCSQCGSALTSNSEAALIPERRQISVMFCDLVDSVRWIRTLDPEDWLVVLRSYQDCAGKIIRENHGQVTRYLGDGILAVFGFPVASEHDAELAVRAALEVTNAVPQLNVPKAPAQLAGLQVRIAIATGEALVGEIVGERASEEQVVVGATPNIAARLQEIAVPNSVVVDDQTRRLLGNMFECEDHGLHEFKGFTESVRAWKVMARGQYESIFRASHGYQLTTLVDREEELSLLEKSWQAARVGRGQVVLLGGEPGIGKSRIVEALHDRISETYSRLVYQCSPMYTHSALSPVRAQIEFAAGFSRQDSDSEKWVKLGKTVTGTERERRECQARFAELLGIAPPPGVSELEPAADAKENRRRMFETFRSQVRAWATERPLLVVFEDVQWIDPTSLELLNLIVHDIQQLPALVIVTHRPEFVPPLGDFPHIQSLSIGRLPSNNVELMIKQVQGGDQLSRAVVDQVIVRTDGIPLYIEEVIAAIHASKAGGLPGPGVGDMNGSIPSTLKASLTARLDTLGEARKLAQLASVIGREFAYSLLSAVVEWSAQQLHDLLAQLVSSGLVHSRGTVPDCTYFFKHALVRDVAYETLLRSHRRQCHLRIANAMDSRFPEIANGHPEVVAQHYSKGNDLNNAVEYWLRAGQRAAANSQNAEAVANFTAGLRLIRRLPRTKPNLRRELQFLVARGPSLITTRGAATQAVRRNYDRALALCQQLEESELHFAAYWGSLRIGESYSSKLERVKELQSLSEKLNDPGFVLQAHHRQWATLFHLGRHAECLQHVGEGLDLYTQGDYRDHGMKYAGHDPKVCAHGEAALSLWLLGRGDEALVSMEQALEWARALDHSGSIAHAMDIASMLHRYRRDVPALEEQAAEMQRFGERHQMVEHVSKARVFLGWTMAQRGRIDESLAILESELQVQLKSNTPEDFPVFFDSLAEVLALAGRMDEALEVNRDAFEISRANDISYWSAELHRCQGEILRLRDARSSEPVACYEKALHIAREQGARALELRAALSLGRYWRDRKQDKRAEAALEPVLAAFDPAMESVDLSEAREMVRRPV
jgi:class 3 adenylate cyclase/predicted ATPase